MSLLDRKVYPLDPRTLLREKMERCLAATGEPIGSETKGTAGFFVAADTEDPTGFILLGYRVETARGAHPTDARLEHELTAFAEKYWYSLGIKHVEWSQAKTRPTLRIAAHEVAVWEAGLRQTRDVPTPASAPRVAEEVTSRPVRDLERVYKAALARANETPQTLTLAGQRKKLLEDLRALLYDWSES